MDQEGHSLTIVMRQQKAAAKPRPCSGVDTKVSNLARGAFDGAARTFDVTTRTTDGVAGGHAESADGKQSGSDDGFGDGFLHSRMISSDFGETVPTGCIHKNFWPCNAKPLLT